MTWPQRLPCIQIIDEEEDIFIICFSDIKRGCTGNKTVKVHAIKIPIKTQFQQVAGFTILTFEARAKQSCFSSPE